MIENFTPVSAVVGGALIGAAASLLWWSDGRVAGISGIWDASVALTPRDRRWQVVFVAGLFLGGLACRWFAPEVFAVPAGRSLAAVTLGGLLVGFGTRMGRGCTSGHGICGLSRGSSRSLAAVVTFMATGFATATALGWLGWTGGAP
ncbi:MAG: YeeE/YedE thiosulfate transporter family protein [Myxococcota bacterium]